MSDALRRSGRVPQPRADVSPEPVAEVSPDAERVREAIRGSTRRTVVRTAVWSVPVIAAATAAPAFAASPPFCATCNGTSPPTCLLNGTGNGSCQCSAGLVCVGTGPLGLTNVCVGSTLVTTTCGGGSCFGVCLTAGGAAVTAVQTFTTGLTAALNAAALLGVSCNASVTTVNGGIPSNICASPVAQGGVGSLGALCLLNPASGGSVTTTVSNLVNTLIGTLNGLGLGPASSCATGYTCQPGVRATLQQAGGAACSTPIPIVLIGKVDLTLGFCRC